MRGKVSVVRRSNFVSRGLAVVLMGVALAACGSTDPEADPSTDTAAAGGRFADEAVLDEMNGHANRKVYEPEELREDSKVRVVGEVVSVTDGPVRVVPDGDQVYRFLHSVITVRVTEGLGANATQKPGTLVEVAQRRGTEITDPQGQPAFEHPVPPTSLAEHQRAIPVGTRVVLYGNPPMELTEGESIEQGTSKVAWDELINGTSPQRFSLEVGDNKMSGWPGYGYEKLVDVLAG